jgi:hypothetical protein
MSLTSFTLFEGTDFKCEKATNNKTRLHILRPNVFDLLECSDETKICLANGCTYIIRTVTTNKNGSYIDCYLM